MNDFAGHRARKRFGQNFLHDRGVIQRIIAAVQPRPGDHLVEIGPGQGALTLPLLDAAGSLEAVEMDRDLVPRLQALCAGHGELVLHQGDALRFDFRQCHGGAGRLRLIGNLPYNISTPLLFHLLKQADLVLDMHFMLQREVVERMAAQPGSKTYGRLSVMIQYACEVEALFRVPPGAFNPAPKVESAIVRLTPKSPDLPACDQQRLATVVAAAFGQRRKTLRRALAGVIDTGLISTAGIDPGARAEQLTVEQFVRLANASSPP
jgi:16S rRNA (adenine1518-N6/adenine1519-N6)-dimethyltransferase